MFFKFVEYKEDNSNLISFLNANNLSFQDYDWGYEIIDNNTLVGCGFVKNHLLLMIAIDKHYRHKGLLKELMLKLLEMCIRKKIDPVYLFTKVEHRYSFLNCGFYTIVKDDVCLMSNDKKLLSNRKIYEYFLTEKWPYSSYFCDKEEYQIYKEKIKEKIKNDY